MEGLTLYCTLFSWRILVQRGLWGARRRSQRICNCSIRLRRSAVHGSGFSLHSVGVVIHFQFASVRKLSIATDASVTNHPVVSINNNAEAKHKINLLLICPRRKWYSIQVQLRQNDPGFRLALYLKHTMFASHVTIRRGWGECSAACVVVYSDMQGLLGRPLMDRQVKLVCDRRWFV